MIDEVLNFDPRDLFINLSDKRYSKDNRLNKNESSNQVRSLAPGCRLIFSKICIRFIGGIAHPIKMYVSWVQTDVNQVGLYM